MIGYCTYIHKLISRYPRNSIEKACCIDETPQRSFEVMQRLSMLCAVALMARAMAVAQDPPQPQRPDTTPRTEQYETRGDRGFDSGWLGLLGLLGLAGRRRGERVNSAYYDDTRLKDENIRGRAA